MAIGTVRVPRVAKENEILLRGVLCPRCCKAVVMLDAKILIIQGDFTYVRPNKKLSHNHFCLFCFFFFSSTFFEMRLYPRESLVHKITLREIQKNETEICFQVVFEFFVNELRSLEWFFVVYSLSSDSFLVVSLTRSSQLRKPLQVYKEFAK